MNVRNDNSDFNVHKIEENINHLSMHPYSGK